MKTNFHNKNFTLSLAFIMRFKATRKWPIGNANIIIGLYALFPVNFKNCSGNLIFNKTLRSKLFYTRSMRGEDLNEIDQSLINNVIVVNLLSCILTAVNYWLLLEGTLQNKAGHLIMFTQQKTFLKLKRKKLYKNL